MIMTNAKRELLEHLAEHQKEVELIRLVFQEWDSAPIKIEGTLNEVLDKLDLNYDASYGSQHLYGYIWYTDGTWSERSESESSEWWELHECPDKNIIIQFPT